MRWLADRSYSVMDQASLRSVVGLVGAGIVHIAILLLLPAFSRARRLVAARRMAPTYTAAPVAGPPGQPPVLESPDPLFRRRRLPLRSGGRRRRI